MLGLGIGEMLVIGALVLLVVGPDRLPQVLRWAGQNYGKLRRTADELRRAFVLEADRQDAEERLDSLRHRQRAAQQRALAEADEALLRDVESAPADQDPPTPPPAKPVGQKRRFPASPSEERPSQLPPDDDDTETAP